MIDMFKRLIILIILVILGCFQVITFIPSLVIVTIIITIDFILTYIITGEGDTSISNDTYKSIIIWPTLLFKFVESKLSNKTINNIYY